MSAERMRAKDSCVVKDAMACADSMRPACRMTDAASQQQGFAWRDLPTDLALLVLLHVDRIDDQANFVLADPRVALYARRTRRPRAFSDPILHVAILLQDPMCRFLRGMYDERAIRYCRLASASRRGIAWLCAGALCRRLAIKDADCSNGFSVTLDGYLLREEDADGRIRLSAEGRCGLLPTVYARRHVRHGRIEHRDKADNLVRVEFDTAHAMHGRMLHYEYNQHCLTTFARPHPNYGQRYIYVDNLLKRVEYERHHAEYGRIDHFEGGLNVRTMFAAGHAKSGRTDFYDAQLNLVRSTYAIGHPWVGRVDFFVANLNVRSEYEEGHAEYGTVQFYEGDGLRRVEYLAQHAQHGRSDFFEHGRHVRSEFAEGHPQHGIIRFFEHGRHVRSEFAEGHPQHARSVSLTA